MDRRTVLRATVAGAAAFSGSLWAGAAHAAPAQPGVGPYGPLGSADANGIQLPAGFTSRTYLQGGTAAGSPMRCAARSAEPRAG